MPTLPTPCARDGKGPGHQYGLPDLVEPTGTRQGLLPTPTTIGHGSNRSPSPKPTRRPRLHQWAAHLTSTLATSTDDDGRGGAAAALLPTSTAANSRSSANVTAGRTLTDTTRLLPTPRATDGAKGCPGQRGSHGDLTLPSAAVRIPPRTLPTPTASDGRGPGRHGSGGADLRSTVADLPEPAEPDDAHWGVYAAAVARWETLLGRPAPDPTQLGRHSKPVLAPPFVEWLMGLDEHWVTDPELDLPRTLALRVLGNGVVPQQAATALRLLSCPHRWAVPT
ncbi:hypothetical protein ACN27G_28860 [Plantactinospora sp. WMMB334]|uniref:hypothetical protein n=1 Tax=Plantactinospora sp. WMMB334 TaxID=3404119 RepID=UPI003B93F52E